MNRNPPCSLSATRASRDAGGKSLRRSMSAATLTDPLSAAVAEDSHALPLGVASWRPRASVSQRIFELLAHIRPLTPHDRVVCGATNGTILSRHVGAAHPFEQRPEPLDGSTGLGVAFVGLERDSIHLPDVEGVGEHEVLHLGVASRALSGGRQPRGADLHRIGAVCPLERGSGGPTPALRIQIARGANESIVPHDGERHPATLVAISQRPFDVFPRLLDAVGNTGVSKLLPGLRRGRGERASVFGRQRPKSYRPAPNNAAP